MTNETQDSLSSPQSNYLEAIFDPFDGSSKLLSTISSANFNGAIPDLVVQYPDAVTDDLIPGRFFLTGDTYYLITRVDENIDPTTTDTISYNVWYTQGGVEKYKTILNGLKIFTDGTELQIRKDDWTNKSIGSSGWTITTEGNSVFSNVAVRGTIEAKDGYFDGHLYVGDPDDPDSPGGMRIGTNVDGTRENPGTQDGIFINANNYWYDTGLFKIGNATKNVVWDNNDLSVTGDINATGGVFQGKIQIGGMYLGIDASPTSENGIYIDGTNYWYDDGNFSLGTGTNTISFNGSNIVVGTGVNIAGEISANSLLLTSGSFSMSIKSNHNPVSSSIRNITKVILSGTSPQLAEFTTSSAHPFVAGDFIYVSGLSNSGGGLGSLNKVFQVSSVSSNIINVNASSSTKTVSVTADNEDTTLSVVSSTGVYAGMSVSGTGIPSNTTVVSTTATVITISNATTQALSDILITFSPINGTYDYTDSGWTNGQAEYSYDGIYVNQYNYWYSNGLFGIGDGTRGLTWNGSALNVTGIINASAGGTMAGWSIGTDEIFKGTGASKIALNAGANPKIYIGSGFHSSANTGFYVDSTGKFSLSNLLTFNPSLDIPEAITTGTFNSGTNTITVASSSGIVKGMTVLGTGIASNSTVTNISGTTITTSKSATLNGTGVSLTFLIEDFSELQVNGRIKGVLESTSSIVTPRLATTATSVVVSGPTESQIATITTTGHAFITGEKILIENLPETNRLDKLNREFTILSVTDSITLVISLSGITEVTNSTNTSLTGLITLRELTLGLHPTEGFIGTAPNYTDRSSWYHPDGTGIRLDKFNWWFTNNYFRVGSSDSYLKWNGESLDVTGIINAQSGTFTGNVVFGSPIAVRVGPDVFQGSSGIFLNTDNYWLVDSNNDVSFHVGSTQQDSGDTNGIDFNAGSLNVTGTVYATSGRFGGSSGWDLTRDGVLSSGVGPSYIALASADAEISDSINQIFTISKIIIDDEAYDFYDSDFPNSFVDYSTIYIEIPISQNAFNRSATRLAMGANSTTITIDSSVGLFVGMGVTGSGIQAATVISSINPNNNKIITLSKATTTFTSNPITFTPNVVSTIDMFQNKYVYFPSGFTGNLSVLNGRKFIVEYVSNELYAIIDGDTESANTMYDYADVITENSLTHITIHIYGENALSISTSATSRIKTYSTLTIDNSDPDFPNELVAVNGSIQGTYTTGISTVSYVPKLTQGDSTYLLWAGDEIPSASKFSILKNNSSNLINIQNKAVGQSYASQSNESTFAPFTATATGISGSSFVPMIKSRVGGATKTRISVLGQIHNTDNTIHTVLHNLNSTGSEDHKFYFRNDGVFQAPDISTDSISAASVSATGTVAAGTITGNGSTPVGSIVMWHHSDTPPPRWLICNGQAVSSTTYPKLAALMANTPDLRGRFPLAAGGAVSNPQVEVVAARGVASGTITYSIGVLAHSHSMGSLTNETNLANVSTAITEGTVSITEGTLNAFNVSITEGTVDSNSGNHSHGVTGNSSTNTATLNAFFGNTGTIRSFSDDAHTHADGNYTTNSAGGSSSNGADLGRHTHTVNAFTGSVTRGTLNAFNANVNAFTLTNSGVAGSTLGITGASTGTLTITPPYMSLHFIIYAG